MSRWILALFTSMLGLVSALAQSPVDTSKWKRHEARLGGHVFSFKFPTERLWPDFPPTLVSEIDLNDPGTWKGKDESHGPLNTIARFRWENRGWFWQGVLDWMHIDMGIDRRPEWFKGSLLDGEAFKAMIEERNRRGTEESNQKRRERAERTPADSIERRTLHLALSKPGYGFEQVRIGNRIWVRYLSPGNGYRKRPGVLYLTALDESYFVTISIDPSPEPAKGKWGLWVDATVKGLLESVEVRPFSP